MPGSQIAFSDVGHIYFESQKRLLRNSGKLFRYITRSKSFTRYKPRHWKTILRQKSRDIYATWRSNSGSDYIGSAEGHEYSDLQVGDEVNPRPVFHILLD